MSENFLDFLNRAKQIIICVIISLLLLWRSYVEYRRFHMTFLQGLIGLLLVVAIVRFRKKNIARQ